MDTFDVHMLMAVIVIPLLAASIEMLAGTRISERHHVHHDTYAVSLVVPRTLVLVMVFMGALGAAVGWLCHVGVFASDPSVPLAFFIMFQMTLFIMVIGAMRYQVMAYGDLMVVRPAYGFTRTIRYDQIDCMTWTSSFLTPRMRDVRVHSLQGDTVRLWSLLDIEQILLRIDRYDVLVG
ncbi:MAG: hypothetical protein J6D34_01515 [Atopobiaceae bacterium]|nr:hypothetical protein [Atopobiaceae bacterium]